MMPPDDQEKEACYLLRRVFCRIRLLAGPRLNEKSGQEIFNLADAAHNIPLALEGEATYRAILDDEMAMTDKVITESQICTAIR